MSCQITSPLTTNAESSSDLPEIFTTDSSNLKKKKKMFLNEFFSSRGYQEIRIFYFFLIFNSVDLFFIKNVWHFLRR